MLVAKCPKCGQGYYSAKMQFDGVYHCGRCGALLEISEEFPKAINSKPQKKPSVWAKVKEYVTWTIDRRGLL